MHNYQVTKFKAAAVQASPVVHDAPVYFDTPATLEKGVKLIAEAGKNGARLIVFPEGWLPCFTYFAVDLNERTAFMDMWAKYVWASVEIPGPETDALCAAAKSAGAYVVMGLNERDKKFQGRMYNSILYISPGGEIMGIHRKICNTAHERLFHTPGDGGDNLKTVFPTEIGKISGTICGEHHQLPLIYNWAMQGMQVHCSLWPGYTSLITTTDVSTRGVCNSTKSWGVLAAACMTEENRPRNFSRNSYFNQPGTLRGGSGIINPYGAYIAGPVYDQETIVYGDIDLEELDRARFSANLTGAYSRWDLINLNISQQPYQPLHEMAKENMGMEAERIQDLEAKIKRLEDRLSTLANTAAVK